MIVLKNKNKTKIIKYQANEVRIMTSLVPRLATLRDL